MTVFVAIVIAGTLTPIASAQAPSEPAPPITIYFTDGPLTLEPREQDGATYIPVEPLLDHLALGRTDATGFGTLTVRGPRANFQLSDGSPVMTSAAGDHEMDGPAFREDGRWWAPTEVLTIGLARAIGRGFTVEAGGRRIVDSLLSRPSIDMVASATPTGARLTIESETSVNIRVQQEPNQVVLSIDRAPLDPVREALDYRDTTIRSVRFDDTGGASRIVVDTGPLANVRLVPEAGNRTFTVDFFPSTAPLAADPTAPDGLASAGAVRTIVIDAGHGGLDSGTTAHGTLEKDLTLSLAQELRGRLATELDTTVVMTRNQDRELDIGTRTSIANNSEADLLISLHVGYSPDETESLASLFVMRPLSDLPGAAGRGGLFQPWFRAHESGREASAELADGIRERLDRAIPQWNFIVREAPLGLLVGATMPALVVEVGNINNTQDIEALTDARVRDALIDALIDGIESFGRTGR